MQPLPGFFDQKLDLVVNFVEDDGDWVPRSSSASTTRCFAGLLERAANVMSITSAATTGATPFRRVNIFARRLMKVRVEFLDRNLRQDRRACSRRVAIRISAAAAANPLAISA